MTQNNDSAQKYEMICKMEAPYPLNYIPYTDYKALGILIGIMIEKRFF